MGTVRLCTLVFAFFVVVYLLSGLFFVIHAQTTTFEAEDDLFTQWGRVVDDPDASGGSAIESYIIGFLAFGPYTQDFSGTNKRYQATFYLKTDYLLQGEYPIGYIDVAADGRTIAKRHYYTHDFEQVNTYTPFALEFDSPSAGASMQFRTTTTYGRTIHIDRVEVEEVTSSSDGPYVYEAENDLRVFWGEVITDTDASGYGAIKTNVTGVAAFGPYTSDTIGSGQEHVAWFYLKADDTRSVSEAVTIDVYANGTILAQKTVYPIDFYAGKEYQIFELRFTPPNTGLLEYRVFSHGNERIFIDRIEVHEYQEDQPDSDLAFHYDALSVLWRFFGDPVSDADAVDNKAVRTRKNIGGPVTFGPYTEDGIGTDEDYEARFLFKINDNTFDNWPAVYLDVYNTETEQILSTEYLNPERFDQSNEYQEFILPFASPATGFLEYRMYSWASDRVITIDGVDVYRATSTPLRSDEFVYEAESLPRVVGRNVHDPNAYNKQSIRVPKESIGHATFGPYTSDGVGTGSSYTASFSLSIADNTDTDLVALLDVSVDNTPLGSLQIYANDFTSVGEFQTFDIPFTSPSSGNLEYRVFSYGAKNFNIDAITVNTQTP